MITRYNVTGRWFRVYGRNDNLVKADALALAKREGLKTILKRVSRPFPDNWYDDYVVDVATGREVHSYDDWS